MSGKIRTMSTKPFLCQNLSYRGYRDHKDLGIIHFYSAVGGNVPIQLLQESFGDAEAAQNLSIALSGLSCSKRRFPMTLSCFIHK